MGHGRGTNIPFQIGTDGARDTMLFCESNDLNCLADSAIFSGIDADTITAVVVN